MQGRQQGLPSLRVACRCPWCLPFSYSVFGNEFHSSRSSGQKSALRHVIRHTAFLAKRNTVEISRQ